jgi:endoglucanase
MHRRAIHLLSLTRPSCLPLATLAFPFALSCAAQTGTPGAVSNSQTSSSSHSSSSNTGASSSSSSHSSGSTTGAAGGGYTVSGPTVLDGAGHPHIFRGLDRPSLESSSGGNSLSELDYQTMAMWGANIVRIPLNQDFWLSDSPTYDSTYSAVVDQQIQWAEQSTGPNAPNGLDVILDLHWSDRGDPANAPGGQQQMADQRSVAFWKDVPKHLNFYTNVVYKDDPKVLFELYNEPELYNAGDAWGVWLNGGDTGSGSGGADVPNAAGMQQLYDAVRGTGAKNLVLIGGIHYAYDLSGVPGHPIANGSNIVYVTHPYAMNENPGDKGLSTWYTAFGQLAATAPVMATEFGNRQTNGSTTCTTTYLNNFLQYAGLKSVSGTTAPANKLHWSAWAFITVANECSYPTVLHDYYDVNANGALVQAALMAGP